MITRALALNGASKIYIIGRREGPLQETASSVPTNNIIPVVGDVTSKDSLKSIADRIEQEVGYVNLVIANAGVIGPQHRVDPAQVSLEDWVQGFWNHSFEEYQRTFEANVAGVWFTTLAFLSLLDKGNKKGNYPVESQVIATSSIAGFNRRAPGGLPYGQSKAATTHMMKQLSTVLAPYHIRTNVLAPGIFPSEMGDGMIAHYGGKLPEAVVPAGRPGSEEEMGGMVLAMSGRAGGYLNGNVLVIDGGRLATMPGVY